MSHKKIYRVYFEQENATVYEVQAYSESAAINKARKEWIEEHEAPQLSTVES